MQFVNLVISDRNGERTVEYACADEGKVFVDKDGNTAACIERDQVEKYTEVDFSTVEELQPEEALDILIGGGEI